ncbi:MAG TPA: hypothetical protein VFW63_10145 [Acidimicrobiales bacterium]|nr:hypothetical protein [Acidimicrobiales bacterium]
MPEPAPPPGTTSCDSCGAPAEDTAPVHRVYVTSGAWDLTADEPAVESVEVRGEVEVWCFPCRSLYPHQPVGRRPPAST